MDLKRNFYHVTKMQSKTKSNRQRTVSVKPDLRWRRLFPKLAATVRGRIVIWLLFNAEVAGKVFSTSNVSKDLSGVSLIACTNKCILYSEYIWTWIWIGNILAMTSKGRESLRTELRRSLTTGEPLVNILSNTWNVLEHQSEVMRHRRPWLRFLFSLQQN